MKCKKLIVFPCFYWETQFVYFHLDGRKTRGVPSAEDKDAERDPAEMPSRLRDPKADVTTGMFSFYLPMEPE